MKCWLSGVKYLEVVSSENTLYSIVPTDILMYLKIAKRKDLKCFYHETNSIRSDRRC